MRHSRNKLNGLKQRKLAIRRRWQRGERPEHSKALARLMDRQYGSNFEERYHSTEGSK